MRGAVPGAEAGPECDAHAPVPSYMQPIGNTKRKSEAVQHMDVPSFQQTRNASSGWSKAHGGLYAAGDWQEQRQAQRASSSDQYGRTRNSVRSRKGSNYRRPSPTSMDSAPPQRPSGAVTEEGSLMAGAGSGVHVVRLDRSLVDKHAEAVMAAEEARQVQWRKQQWLLRQ